MVQKKRMYMFMMMVVGVLVGVAVTWIVIKGSTTAPVTVSPQIVVVRDVATAQGPKMPVYPEKDPEYPLRNLSHVAEYQQLGVLKSVDGSEPIALPLFGRRMPNRPDRWEYYTATDKQNMLRVPVTFESRDCLEEVGCNEIYKGDQVTVPVYDKMFEVQLYKYKI